MAQSGRGCTIVIDGSDPVAGAPPVQWAAEQLRAALAAKGALCRIVYRAVRQERVRGSAFYVLVNSSAATSSVLAPEEKRPSCIRGARMRWQNPAGAAGLHQLLASTESASHLSAWHPGAESFALTPGRYAGIQATIVSGSDVRGCVYGILEWRSECDLPRMRERRCAWRSQFWRSRPTKCAALGRYFCSEVEDKPWLYDREFWLGYLDLLVACRFNRFCLAFGLEYDFPKGVTSDYLHFPYPYLVNVPGYDVRVMQLAARGRNGAAGAG